MPDGAIEIKHEVDCPKFKRYLGKVCTVCSKQILMTIRYDKRSSDGVEEYSYLSAKCDCGLVLMYRNGAWSFIPKKDFDKNKLLVDELTKSGIKVNVSGFKVGPLPSI
jgi:hypothetical protein